MSNHFNGHLHRETHLTPSELSTIPEIRVSINRREAFLVGGSWEPRIRARVVAFLRDIDTLPIGCDVDPMTDDSDPRRWVEIDISVTESARDDLLDWRLYASDDDLAEAMLSALLEEVGL